MKKPLLVLALHRHHVQFRARHRLCSRLSGCWWRSGLWERRAASAERRPMLLRWQLQQQELDWVAGAHPKPEKKKK
jgi:hypothetical protein